MTVSFAALAMKFAAAFDTACGQKLRSDKTSVGSTNGADRQALKRTIIDGHVPKVTLVDKVVGAPIITKIAISRAAANTRTVRATTVANPPLLPERPGASA